MDNDFEAIHSVNAGREGEAVNTKAMRQAPTWLAGGAVFWTGCRENMIRKAHGCPDADHSA